MWYAFAQTKTPESTNDLKDISAKVRLLMMVFIQSSLNILNDSLEGIYLDA